MHSTWSTIILQDSIPHTNLPKDTIPNESFFPEQNERSDSIQGFADSVKKPVIAKTKPVNELITKEQPKKEVTDIFTEIREKNILKINQAKSGTLAIAYNKGTQNIFHYFQFQDKHFQYKPQALWKDSVGTVSIKKELNFNSHAYIRSQLNWALLVGFLSIVILISLKSNYRKFIGQVINTMVNFQLADKLFREKNILVRRAFFMLNLNFLLVFSLFIVLLMNFFEVDFTENQLINYLIIFGGVTGILFIRLILYYLTAFIFEWDSAISQQIHSIYLVNKNMGLILLPIVFAVIYSSSNLSGILIYIGLVLIIIASVYKLLRGFQIILRNGILLFYAILYLCTLEFLPWVIGSKLIIYLR